MKKTILLFFTGLLLVCQASAKKPGFALWQLSPQGPSQMNSYVFVTDKGRVVVLDGGTADDAPFLRGFIAALGNHVDIDGRAEYLGLLCKRHSGLLPSMILVYMKY